MSSVPTLMKAIVLEKPGSWSVEQVPVPKVEYGSVLIKIEAADVNKNTLGFLSSTESHAGFQLPHPCIPGSNAIGRIVVPGPDSTVFRPGQLVLINAFVRGRDDTSIQVLWGASVGFSPESRHLYESTVRNGSFAEYVLAPVENTFLLDETRLLGDPPTGGLGYTVQELLFMVRATIAYGGLRSIDLKAGERIIITPATGGVSGAAVDVAVALGASVVAAGRNAEGLADLKKIHPSIETVQFTGDAEVDTKALKNFGPVDVVLDLSPPGASGVPFISSAIAALRTYGRVCLMGSRANAAVPTSSFEVSFKSLTVKGQFMFERGDQAGLIRLVESGVLKIGKAAGQTVLGSYKLDDISAAMERAAHTPSRGTLVCVQPFLG